MSATNPQFLRDPFPGNIIPSNRLDQVGLNVASIYPLPNGSGNFDNYTSTADRSVRDTAFNVRVDHRASEKDSFFVRYSYDKYKLDAPQGQAACCLPTPPEAASRFDLGPFVAGIQNTRLTTHGGALNWTRIIGPARGQRVPVRLRQDQPRDPAVGLRDQCRGEPGHPGHQRDGVHLRLAQPRHRSRTGSAAGDLTGISGGPAFLPVNPKQTHYQFEDSLSWVKGRHSLKSGYRFILRKPSPFTNTDTRSSITIGRNLTNEPGHQRRRVRPRHPSRWATTTGAPEGSSSSPTP